MRISLIYINANKIEYEMSMFVIGKYICTLYLFKDDQVR